MFFIQLFRKLKLKRKIFFIFIGVLILLFILNVYYVIFDIVLIEKINIPKISSSVNNNGDIKAVVLMNQDWIGVRQVRDSFKLPNYYNNQLNSKWMEALQEYKPDILIFGGTIDVTISNQIKSILPKTKIGLIYNGLPSSHYNDLEVLTFSSAIQALSSGYVDKMAVVQNGFANTLKKKWDKKICKISFYIPLLPRNKYFLGPQRSQVDSKIHIGIFGSSNPNDNVNTQIFAACSLGSDVTIHAMKINNKNMDYMPKYQCKIIWHDPLPHYMFIVLLSQMDINMYINFSESQPLIALESLAAGIPVLLSESSNIFDINDNMRRNMICPQQDNPEAISICIMKLISSLKNSDFLNGMMDFVKEFNSDAEKLLIQFLEGVPNQNKILPDEVDTCSHLSQGSNIDNWYSSPPNTNNLAGSTYVFCTYEVGGVTPGGVGTFIDSMIRILLVEGVNIILLYDDIETSLIRKWEYKLLNEISKGESQLKGKLTTESLSELLPYFSASDRPSSSWKNAKKWERGLVKLYERMPFDAIEMVEYEGPATEILKRRMEGLPTIPKNVKVVVRVHGSYTHIKIADNDVFDKSNFLMVLMERFVIASADIVLYSTMSMRKFYEESLLISSPVVVLGGLPMRALLSESADNINSYNAQVNKDILIWGKLQEVKGVFLVVEAMVMLFQEHPEIESIVTFYGSNNADSEGKMRKMIPPNLLNRFVYAGTLNRNKLPETVLKYRFSIVASKFETFCLAAHELHQLRVPLVVPNISVFKLFSSENSIFFEPGNAISLKNAAYMALSDDALISTLQKSARIVYANPLLGYESVFAYPLLTTSVITKPACELLHNLNNVIENSENDNWKESRLFF